MCVQVPKKCYNPQGLPYQNGNNICKMATFLNAEQQKILAGKHTSFL